MRLSAHFTLEELTVTQQRGLDNTPAPEIVSQLSLTAGYAEEVRELLGHPMLVTSGYRSPAVNQAVGGSPLSQHVKGQAIDFICPEFGEPIDVCRAIMNASHISFDQLIHEYGNWTHISFNGDSNRREVLTTFGNNKYVPGILTKEEWESS